MKKYCLFAILTLFFASCRTDVDLYIENDDTTIVYTILDTNADTNFFKVSKSSLHGDYYYDKDDIDVYFAGRFKDENNVDTLKLELVTKMEDKRLQSFYFTTKELREDEEYELFIIRKADGVKVSAKTRTICPFVFLKPLPSNKYIDFKSNVLKNVEWKGTDPSASYKINGEYYNVVGYFHYRELMPGAHDTVDRCFEWFLGSGQTEGLFNTTDNYYFIQYMPSRFFYKLETDEYLVNNSPHGVKRWLKDFEFKIFVTGEDLYYYNVATGADNHYPEVPNYTNIENGIGLMSVRTTKSTFRTIEQICRKRIANNYPYGFYYDPNR